MNRKLLSSAIGAGCVAWLLAAMLHFAFIQKYILLGEDYETGAAVHFAGVPAAGEDAAAAAEHSHDGAEVPAEHSHDSAEAAHDHGDEGEVSTLTRNLWTTVFYGIVYVGYGLILVAGFGIASLYGKVIGAREGLLWGLAGCGAFLLAPALGLAPELPGTPAADLGDRQLWWWGTVIATGLGFGLLAYGRGIVAVAIAIALLALPHVIGAPELDGFAGVAPPEVAGAFAARVLVIGLVIWAVLGWTAGYIWAREADTSA
jgi:cobalt transporter subunit CbtA